MPRRFVLRQGLHDPETKPAETRRWLGARGDLDADAAPGHGPVRSFVLSHDRPLDRGAFGLWFSLLVHRHGGRLLRVKGLLDVEGSAIPVAIHAVQYLIHAPEHLPA